MMSDRRVGADGALVMLPPVEDGYFDMKTTTLGERHADSNQSARFERLMAANYPRVLKMAFRLCGDRSDAEDLTQEAFFRAFRRFDTYDGKWPFESWILRIVSRLHLDMLRTRRRRIHTVSYDALGALSGDESWQFETADDRPGPQEVLLARTWSEELLQVLATLSSDQRLIVRLADVEDRPYQEIAEIIGKPIGTVRSRLHRTHKLLTARLEQTRKHNEAPPTPELGNVAFKDRIQLPAPTRIGGRTLNLKAVGVSMHSRVA